MMRPILAALALALTLAPAHARADGLLYTLPKDGSWVEYDMQMDMSSGPGERKKATGTFWLSSVGRATEDGEACRYLEMHLQAKLGDLEQDIVVKVLIPEKHLKQGQDPTAHIVRGWIRENDETKALDKDRYGPMPGFLAAKLKEAKKLDSKEIETGLGKLKCEGLSGSTEWDDGGATIKAVFEEIRLHEKSPFGVARAKMRLSVTRDGQTRERGVMTLTLKKTGENAPSQLADKK